MSTCKKKNKEPIALTKDIEKSHGLWRMMMTYDDDVWFWAAGFDIYKQQHIPAAFTSDFYTFAFFFVDCI